MLYTFIPLILATVVSWITVPAIIKIAYQKRLVDDPKFESRKVHHHSVPNLGGVAVFSTFALIGGLFLNDSLLPNANYIFAAGILVFCIGLKDDLVALDPYKKFLAQFITSFIVVYLADMRFSSFYGVFGIQDISPALSYIFTSFFIVFTINAFNLIDGVNGLLGSLATTITLTYGFFFYLMGETGWSILSFSLAGALIGFLRFNMGNRARIFMGDGGAYCIGFIVALLSISFVELNRAHAFVPDSGFWFESAPAIVLALLIIPAFDTFRVFAKRIINGKSPFFPDRNHLHHRLLNMRLSHSQITYTLVVSNMLFIALAFGLRAIGTVELMLLIAFTAQFINFGVWLYDSRMQLIRENQLMHARDNVDILMKQNELIPTTEQHNNHRVPNNSRVPQDLLDELGDRKN